MLLRVVVLRRWEQTLVEMVIWVPVVMMVTWRVLGCRRLMSVIRIQSFQVVVVVVVLFVWVPESGACFVERGYRVGCCRVVLLVLVVVAVMVG